MLLQYAPQLAAKRIVLASASPRRRELLGNLGLRFEILVPTFDETLPKSSFPTGAAYATATAKQKALEVSNICRKQADRTHIIIAADTVVEHAGDIMEKPDDDAHAFAMLSKLSGSRHQVHTGVVIVVPAPSGEDHIHEFSSTTHVQFDTLSDEVIRAYIATGEPFGKAGSYGIQGAAGSFVSGIEGCYFNVVGFPIHRFAKELAATTCWPLPLVRHVAAHGMLWRLELTHWVPEYAALLAPLAACLVRLSVGVPAASGVVLEVLWSLGRLRALRCLHVRLRQQFDWPWLADWEMGSTVGGWNMVPFEVDRKAIKNGRAPMTNADRGATWQVASGGSSADAQERGRPLVALPPGLRQLCLVVPDLPPGLEGWCGLGAPQLAELPGAAARQDYVVRVADLRRSLGSLLLPEYDDGHGYRDGAAAAFVEARCREW